ncbi:MAG: type sorting protein [Flaviaesturariibacter sp.]|nr:type sorting protein [Flaviaesturariibacter sp.]
MKHIYSVALATALSLASLCSFAQHATTVAPSDKCQVLEDFSDNSGNFRSPSIFTESDYTEFSWDSTAGYWMEQSGLASRSGSLISPVYINQQLSGGIDVGFAYQVCPGAEYRIRIINVQCTCVGGYDVVATTSNGPVWTAFPSTSGRLCIRLNDADLYEGQKFRVEVSYRNTSACNWVFDDFSLGGDEGAIILPVTFLGITAKKEAASVSIRWDVADEIDVRGYEVEKSTNGVNFTKVGSLSANGKPAYSFTDAAATNDQVVYYRVKNVDIDGRFKYSSVVKLNQKTNSASTVLKAFPIPAQNTLTLQHERLGAAGTITVATLDGRTIKRIQPGASAIQTQIDLSSLAPGMYLVQTNDEAGNKENIKIVKQ